MPPVLTPEVPTPETSDVPARFTWVLWAIAAVSTALALAGGLSLAVNRFQIDMGVYLMGAHNLVDGRLYAVSLPGSLHLPFTYPPFAALVFAPLAMLPQSWAQVTGAVVNELALFVLLLLALRAARPGLGRRGLLLWTLVLMGPAYWTEPVRLTFGFGQVNVVLAAMVLGDLTCRLRFGSRTLPRGVLVGLAAAVKLIPLVFVPYLFVTRQFRAAWVAIGTFLACSAVSVAADPRVSWSYWTKYATDAGRVGGVFYISNQSLLAAADRFDHRVLPSGLTTAASGLVVVVGVVLAAWAYHSSSHFLGVLVCATTGLLASPITWAHHMVWVVPIFCWLVWAPDRPAGGRVWAAAGAGLFWWAPIWTVPNGSNQELSESAWQLLRGNSFFFAAVVFLVGVACMLWVRRRHPVPDVPTAPAV